MDFSALPPSSIISGASSQQALKVKPERPEMVSGQTSICASSERKIGSPARTASFGGLRWVVVLAPCNPKAALYFRGEDK
jgi:hypothetical protein